MLDHPRKSRTESSIGAEGGPLPSDGTSASESVNDEKVPETEQAQNNLICPLMRSWKCIGRFDHLETWKAHVLHHLDSDQCPKIFPCFYCGKVFHRDDYLSVMHTLNAILFHVTTTASHLGDMARRPAWKNDSDGFPWTTTNET